MAHQGWFAEMLIVAGLGDIRTIVFWHQNRHAV